MILVVEDDENDLVLLRRELKAAKVLNPVHVCQDGEAAIRYLGGAGEFSNREKFPIPVLVLLDLKLPRRSGSEVLAWVEGNPDLHAIPILVLTAQTDPKHLAQVSHLGAVKILQKPVAASVLLDQLRQVNRLLWKKGNEGDILELSGG